MSGVEVSLKKQHSLARNAQITVALLRTRTQAGDPNVLPHIAYSKLRLSYPFPFESAGSIPSLIRRHASCRGEIISKMIVAPAVTSTVSFQADARTHSKSFSD